ncbi:hypothetical protein [Winogradskyella sediminis]|uniref:hypothetical protein n=1 Tax=Winogradskyella sediminis TaxID=1382466 RepID=UPI000E280B0F|nr:hypothetical protein [Winogradskyella sediminis]REG83149.1 hypothetical protein C8N41_1156 [Winogradskyella sediminis]
MREPQNPNDQLEVIIMDSELPSIAKDYAELAVDGIMDDGILKDIPLVGTVIGIMKFSNSVNKHFAIKKIYKFLNQLNSIPQELRVKKIDEINNSKKYQSSVGEMIFEILKKIESDGKPEIIGRLFKAVIEEKIDYITYLRIAHLVKNLFYYDIVWLKENTTNGVVAEATPDPIFTSGLVDVNFVDSYEGAKNDIITQKSQATLTEIGKVLINVGME